MEFNRLYRLIAGVLLLCSFAPAQYGDYEWARALTSEFSFDDMAEKVLRDLMTGPGRTDVEKQQGRLGLAEMKQAAARQAGDLEGKLALYDEARKLMQEAVDNWPEKNTLAYFGAIFTLTELLQERGEIAMTAVAEAKVDGAKAEAIKREAEADYGRAEKKLEAVRESMGEPNPEDDREKWRVKNRAWYLGCLLKYNKALTGKRNSAKREFALSEAAEMLEEFILENETDDMEAMLGALYGYIQLGRVQAARGEPGEAIGNFTSVLDVIEWEDPEDPNYRLAPPIQGLVELAYYRLLEYLNEAKRYADTVRYGAEMESRFKKMTMVYKKLGRAARVEYAAARLNQGDMSGALGIATEVVDAAAGDASGVLANRLVAEIIASTPDKTQFQPEIIRSAAKGAYSQGAEKRLDAIKYFQILLQVLPQIEDEATRRMYEAEAWYDMGRAYYFMGRQLEAAFCFGEGTRRCKDVTENDLNENLARMWRSTVRSLAEETKSPEIAKLRREMDDWMIKNPIGTVSPGTLLYNKARAMESEARDLRRKKNLAGAIARYDQAASTYEEAITAGGPKKEQAMIKGARTGLTVAQLLIGSGDRAKAMGRLQQAKSDFKEYIAYAKDPKNNLTDPRYISSREAARAEARYSISFANRLIMGRSPDAATAKRLWEETLPYLRDFEKTYKSQTGLCVAVVADRIKAHIALGNFAEAESDYKALRDLDPNDARTATAAFSIGKLLRKDADAAWEKVVGKVTPYKPDEWAEVMAKPGFQEALDKIRTCYGYYREWLLAGSGQTDFGYWELVAYLWGRTGDWEAIADIHQKALSRFKNTKAAATEKNKGKMLLWKNKLLHAYVTLARAADAEKRPDDASRMWAEASVVAKELMEPGSKYAKNPYTVRLAAQCFGGYVSEVAGLVSYRGQAGDFRAALELWKRIKKSLEASGRSGSDPWWEARFYEYYAAYELAKADKKPMAPLRQKLDALIANNRQQGAWTRYFQWLKSKLF